MAPEPQAPGAFEAFALGALPRLRGWVRHAGTFGSAGSMVLAALLGAATFAFALAAPKPPAPAIAPEMRGRLTDVSAPAPAAAEAPGALAPMGAPPPAAIETALDYDVVFFWPARPQTVASAAAIRKGPAAWAPVIRNARPGERLRINGRVDDAPNGPWLRVRLADGQDGYFAARTVDVGVFRQRRAEEAPQVAATGETPVEAAGAPLIAPPPDEAAGPEAGAPSF